MTWIVKLTPANPTAEPAVIKIPGNSVDELLDGEAFRWKILDRLMERGILAKVEIDFRASMYGVKRIRKSKGLYFLTIDNHIASPGFTDRQQAWEWKP